MCLYSDQIEIKIIVHFNRFVNKKMFTEFGG